MSPRRRQSSSSGCGVLIVAAIIVLVGVAAIQLAVAYWWVVLASLAVIGAFAVYRVVQRERTWSRMAGNRLDWLGRMGSVPHSDPVTSNLGPAQIEQALAQGFATSRSSTQ